MGSSCEVSVERLESRVLMAVDVSLSKRGRLFITAPEGDVGGDVIEIDLLNGRRNVQVFVNGVVVDPTPRGGSSTTVRRTQIRRIVADLGAGDDEIYVGRLKSDPVPARNRLSVRSTLSGGEGNDTLQGAAAADLLIGGPGDDILFGDRGDDVFFGGTGNDQILGEGGRDNLFGQEGDDRLNGGGNEDALYGMAGADDLAGGEDDDFLNPNPGPGDITDRNDKPDNGQSGNAAEYVDKLIELGVPDRFREDARS